MSAKHRAIKKKQEAFTIVKGRVPSKVSESEMDRMNKKFGGWWPIHMKA